MNTIIADLAKNGYAKLQVFGEPFMTPLAQWSKNLPMQKANIVHGKDYRSDETYWLDASRYDDFIILKQLHDIQTMLNGYHLLKTTSMEAHIAHYAPGTKYGKHLDATKKDNKRFISLVGYFNPGWHKGQGGELRLYTENGIVDIPPFHGTGVLFLSEEIEHEVLETKMDRWSVAAWFRK